MKYKSLMKKTNGSISRNRIIYLVTTLFLVALSFYAFVEIKNLISSSNLVTHTNQVNLSLQKISSYIIDAETNQFGYLLTGDSLLITKKDTNLNRLKVELNLLESLISDNPHQ